MFQRDFEGPLLKVERADHHIQELERLLERYVAENRKRFSPKRQERALKEGREVRFAEPARHTPTVLGDAIHNLRASLDHAYCILIEANGHTATDYSKFPFGKDWPSVKGFINGQIKERSGPSDAVRDFIGAEVQPFPGGRNNLWDLHRLDITDKHQRILPMGNYAFLSKIIFRGGEGSAVEFYNAQFANFHGSLAKGAVALLEDNIKNAFDVTFGKGQPLEGQPILTTLKTLRANVAEVLKGLSAFL
jgi:hypothetical protein